MAMRSAPAARHRRRADLHGAAARADLRAATPRDRHLWLAVSALGVAGMAASVIARSAATTTAGALAWQSAQMAFGAVLAVGFVRWAAALGLHRPRLDARWMASSCSTSSDS
jgi:hypothetical protein